MTINLIPYYDKTYNCLENIYATVLNSYNVEHILMFAYSWSFAFYPKGDTLGARMKLSRHGKWRIEDQDELIRRFCGVEINWHRIMEDKDIYDIAKSEIEESRPVCICIDSFCCPWHPLFQKDNIPHYILIIGFDDKKKSYLCMDPQYLGGIGELPYDYYSSLSSRLHSLTTKYNVINHNTEGFKGCATFKKGRRLEQIDYEALIERALIRMNMESLEFSDFNSMRKLAGELESLENINIEVEGKIDFNDAWLFRKIENIGGGRINFSKVLMFISNKSSHVNNEYKEIAHKLELCSRSWDNLRLLFFKAFYQKDQKRVLMKISNKVKDIADYEENIALELLKCVSKYRGERS